MKRLLLIPLLGVVSFVLPAIAAAQTRTDGTEALKSLSAAVQALSARVSPGVVQVVATGFAAFNDGDQRETSLVMGRQRLVGSGVILDADGSIVTNAHVVKGARRVQVVLETPDGRGRTVDARIVGATQELDLALLKIEEKGLTPLPLANYNDVRQGQLVFAFGSPQGLRDTVTMGVVSARDRQPDPDNPIAYIQTDAPIAKGNSGGPLLNASGEVVGINTLMLSNDDGSKGQGFALPSSLVAMAVPKLRQYGRLHRGRIGVSLQTMTPQLAEGLGLPRTKGALVADVIAGGPADTVGMRVGDVIISVDGEPVDSVLPVATRLFTSNGNESLRLRYQRWDEVLTADVAVVEEPNDLDRLTDLVDPSDGLVPLLGIVGVTIDSTIASQVPSLRFPLGVVVAARAPVAASADVTLVTGDVIHGVNGEPVRNIEQLRRMLENVGPRRSVVLQIERNGQFSFMAFDAP